MRKIGKLLVLFMWNVRLSIARSMEYRFNFILGSLISLLFSYIGPILQYLIFTQTKGFPGWNLDQIILFQGVLLTVLGIRSTLFGELHSFISNLVWRGELDRLLLKPYPPIGIILVSGFSMNSIGSILSGVIIVIYSIVKMELSIGLLQWLMLLVFILAGLVLYMGFEVLYSSVVLVLVQIGRLNEIVDYLARFGEYPLDIFSRTMRLMFITVIPFAVWVYIPAKLLLGALDAYMACSFVFCILFFIFCLKIWGLCLKKYTSAGG